MVLETNQFFRDTALNSDLLKPVTQQDVEKIQIILADCLADIDTFCRTRGLRYMLCGGTALGAVRHKGFIPWDEDVDIGMPRRDFEEFKRLFAQEMVEKYWLQSIDTSERYDLNFIKIRRKGTVYCELFEQEPEVAGVFIDVYPLENVPDSGLLRLVHGTGSDFLYFCESCRRIYSKRDRLKKFTQQSKGSALVRLKSAIGFCLSFLTTTQWCRLADKWTCLCRSENTQNVTFPTGRHHYFGEMCSRDSFFPTKECEFGTLRLQLMNKPEEYLEKQYGDYMQIPPENKREKHSVIEIVLE